MMGSHDDDAPRGRDAHRDHWPDPLDAAADGRADAAAAASGGGDDVPPPLPGRPPRGQWRSSWLVAVGIVLVAVAGMVARRSLLGGGASPSASVLFVGGPALLAWLLVRRGPAETATGRVLSGVTVCLLLLAVLFGEAALCVLLAAPLVYAVAGLALLLTRLFRERTATMAVVALVLPTLPLVPGDPVRTVEVTRVVALDTAAVAARVEAGPSFDTEALPWLLTLGYPVPDRAERSVAADGTVRWTFPYGEGATVADMVPTPTGWRFDVVEDDAMARWFTLHAGALDLAPTDAGTRVTMTLRFDPALGPDWYFGGIEERFLAAAGEHLLDGLDLRDTGATTTVPR